MHPGELACHDLNDALMDDVSAIYGSIEQGETVTETLSARYNLLSHYPTGSSNIIVEIANAIRQECAANTGQKLLTDAMTKAGDSKFATNLRELQKLADELGPNCMVVGSPSALYPYATARAFSKKEYLGRGAWGLTRHGRFGNHSLWINPYSSIDTTSVLICAPGWLTIRYQHGFTTTAMIDPMTYSPTNAFCSDLERNIDSSRVLKVEMVHG